MDTELQEEMDLCAVLNLVPYLDHDFLRDGQEMTLWEIVDEYSRTGPGEESPLLHQQAYTVLESYVRTHEERAKQIVLIDESHIERPWISSFPVGNNDPTDDLTQACTFRDGDGNFYVAYRGTGAGKWEDNGDGMTESSTLMQEASKQYFDEMSEKYFAEAYRMGKEVTVTGHSKGGNEAQFVYMTSDYEYLITRCCNFDGQGFSRRAADGFRKRYGEGYEDKISGMYTICGKNDFVHDLGIGIVPEENTYFVENSGSGPASMHMLEHMIGDEDGNYAPLRFSDENDGKGTQGTVGAFAKKLSEMMMQLEEEDLHGAALALMAITDRAMNGGEKPETIGDAEADWTDYIDLVAHGVPELLAALFLTKEGHGLIGDLARAGAEKWGDFGAAGIYSGVLLLSAACLPQLTTTLTDVVVTAKIADLLIDSADAMEDVSSRAAGFLSSEAEVLFANTDRYNGKTTEPRNPDSGDTVFSDAMTDFQHAEAASQMLSAKIHADTDLMQNYAGQLRDLNRRLLELYSRLSGFSRDIGIWKLRELLIFGPGIGRSSALERCSVYLESTAQDLIFCENVISGRTG